MGAAVSTCTSGSGTFPPTGARWQIEQGEALAWLGALDFADVVITDPPYSRHVHENQKRIVGKRKVAKEDLGFSHLTPALRRGVARELARVTRRWALVFCATEQAHLWRNSLIAAGMRYVRTGFWRKLLAQPQISGDRPSVVTEAIVIAHHPRHRLYWNGHGAPAFWDAPLEEAPWWDAPVAHGTRSNEGGSKRFHTTQKPLLLLDQLVRQFSDAGETVFDPFSGSATTGAAAIRLGRHYRGCELDATMVARSSVRLHAISTSAPAWLDPRQLSLHIDR